MVATFRQLQFLHALRKQCKQDATAPLHSLSNMQTPARQRGPNANGAAFGGFTIPKLKPSTTKPSDPATVDGGTPACNAAPTADGLQAVSERQQHGASKQAGPAEAMRSQLEPPVSSADEMQESAAAKDDTRAGALPTSKARAPPLPRMLPPTSSAAMRKPAPKPRSSVLTAHCRSRLPDQPPVDAVTAAPDAAARPLEAPTPSITAATPHNTAAATAEDSVDGQSQQRARQAPEDHLDGASELHDTRRPPPAETLAAQQGLPGVEEALGALQLAPPSEAAHPRPASALRSGRRGRPAQAGMPPAPGTEAEGFQQTPGVQAPEMHCAASVLRAMPSLREATVENTPALQR